MVPVITLLFPLDFIPSSCSEIVLIEGQLRLSHILMMRFLQKKRCDKIRFLLWVNCTAGSYFLFGLSLCRLSIPQGPRWLSLCVLTHSFDLDHLWGTEKVWGKQGRNRVKMKQAFRGTDL